LSSTNRSAARKLHIADYYITPIPEIIKFLDEFKKIEPNINNMMILDPAAGGDANHPMSYPEAFKQAGLPNRIYTIDIRQDSLADKKTDYLKLKLNRQVDMIITNPPFNIALDIIKKALNDTKEGGWVIMLLRLNFFETKERKPFWEENMSEYAFVHHKRMSFTDKGGTDSVAYMHCCWRKGYNPEFCKLKII
jgi:hypothetical protein